MRGRSQLSHRPQSLHSRGRPRMRASLLMSATS